LVKPLISSRADNPFSPLNPLGMYIEFLLVYQQQQI
jgi:hypothetical protein